LGGETDLLLGRIERDAIRAGIVSGVSSARQ